MTEFLHIVIDLGLRQIITPDGTPRTICQVDANMPILHWYEDSGNEEDRRGITYSLGRELKANNALHLDITFFQLIVKRCGEHMCFCVIAPTDIEDRIYHIRRIEPGRVISLMTPDGAIGKVSKGSRFEYDLVVGSLAESFRIETIPNEDFFYGKSKLTYRETGGES